MDFNSSNCLKPAVLTVGNELVYGERTDTNKVWMFFYLREVGLPAEVGLTLPDDENIIAQWVRVLKIQSYSPIFVSGGIGGTHDDRTRQGIALGLGRKLVRHEECYKILQKRYGKFFTGQRKRMAWLPEGSGLIPNDTGAPGFFADNLYAFPGFPSMLQPMFKWVIDHFFASTKKVQKRVFEWTLPVHEGVIGDFVEGFCNAHSTISVGLYPHVNGPDAKVTVRLRCNPEEVHLAEEFEKLLREYLKPRNIEF